MRVVRQLEWSRVDKVKQRSNRSPCLVMESRDSRVVRTEQNRLLQDEWKALYCLRKNSRDHQRTLSQRPTRTNESSIWTPIWTRLHFNAQKYCYSPIPLLLSSLVLLLSIRIPCTIVSSENWVVCRPWECRCLLEIGHTWTRINLIMVINLLGARRKSYSSRAAAPSHRLSIKPKKTKKENLQ